MEEPPICAVCQYEIHNDPEAAAHVLPCGHPFHAGCIVEWFRRGEARCPVCRNTGATETIPSHDSSSTTDFSSDEEVLSEDEAIDLERFRLFSSRAEVGSLIRASLAAVRRDSATRSRPMQRLQVRAARFLKATEEANDARTKANLFLRTHSGPLLSGLKRYNALVRMWGTRERRLRDAALDLYVEHTLVAR